MNKLIVILVALALICASALAEGIDWASMTDEELHAAIEAAQAELDSRAPAEGEGDGIVVKDGAVLFDYEGITVVVEGDPWLKDSGDRQYIYFTAVTTNDSDNDIVLGVEDCSVNGWAAIGYGGGEIPAHKKSRDDWYIYATDAAPSSLADIEECLMSFILFDFDYNVIYQTEISNFSFNG